MKNQTKAILGVILAIVAAAQTPAVQGIATSLYLNHPNISAIVGGVSLILTTLHVPSQSS